MSRRYRHTYTAFITYWGLRMIFIGNAILLFLAGFIGYMLHADYRNPIGLLLLIALPVIGVYFLGWWALLTFAIGIFSGITSTTKPRSRWPRPH
jgi:hypothetical protein